MTNRFRRFGRSDNQDDSSGRGSLLVRAAARWLPQAAETRPAPPVEPSLQRTREARFDEYRREGERVPRDEPRFALLLDATGSMSALIDEAKRHVRYILQQALKEGDAKLQIVVYRDYDCGLDLVDASELTSDEEALEAYLSRVDTMGGGGNLGEAVEAGLGRVLEQDVEWTAVIVAGDEPAHSASTMQKAGGTGRTADEWAEIAARKGIKIFTLVVPGHVRQSDTVQSFQRIAELTGAATGFLDDREALKDILGLIVAYASKRGAAAAQTAVRQYANERQLGPGAAAFARRLLPGRHDG